MSKITEWLKPTPNADWSVFDVFTRFEIDMAASKFAECYDELEYDDVLFDLICGWMNGTEYQSPPVKTKYPSVKTERTSPDWLSMLLTARSRTSPVRAHFDAQKKPRTVWMRSNEDWFL